MPTPDSTPRAYPERRRRRLLLLALAASALLTALVAALFISIAERRFEARNPFLRTVEVDEHSIDPADWGANWPHQYDSYKRTVDYERTRYGGSDAVPVQKLDEYPWLRKMWAGYAFALDYRESRGHAFMLHDQDHTERVAQRPQPGACLHCHASILPIYREVGGGMDFEHVLAGFEAVNKMSWNEARNLTDAEGERLITHSVSCVDCHEPSTMALRVTRPAFILGMQALANSDDPVPHLPSVARWRAGERATPYDVNELASRHELRSLACAQCHVEYYFTPADAPQGPKQLVYPWHEGLQVEDSERYYDGLGYSDFTHAITGAGVLKAQHPEFELWSQGIHARAGVSCADCHMPYERVGAMKVSNHHVRSPLLNVSASCQVCHNVPEQELIARATTIQDRTHELNQRASAALMDLIDAAAAARAGGVSDAELAEVHRAQRRAQWRIDYVFSEGSRGFHAAQESARILGEAIDYARQGERDALLLRAPALSAPPVLDPQSAPLEGVTPHGDAPPSPRNP